MAMLQRRPKCYVTDSESFKSKTKIQGNTPADSNTKNVEITVKILN